MCVAVTLLPGATLTEEEIWKMGTTNSDGFGMAWIEDGHVKWYRSVKYAPAIVASALYKFQDSPRLVHFRYSTVGGTRVELCHPFEIAPRPALTPRGTSKRVLIHNGHWARWTEVKELLDKEGLLPVGPWSDTRLAAYLASQDPEWLEVLAGDTGKVATLDSDGQLTHIGNWIEFREGMRVSNLSWNVDSDRIIKKGGYSGFRKWQGWDWTEKDWENYAKAREEEEKAQAKTADQGSASGTGGALAKELPGPPKELVGPGTAGQRPAGDSAQSGSEGVERCGVRDMGRNPGLRKGEPEFQASSRSDKDKPRIFDQRPWRDPQTGRIWQVSETGHVVEVTSAFTEEEARHIELLGFYLDGE